MGAEVVGPVATAADADRLIAEQTPDVSIVDFNLRGGELAHGLIGRLNERGIHVIVISGYSEVPLAPGATAIVLQKPIVEAQLLAPCARSPNKRRRDKSSLRRATGARAEPRFCSGPRRYRTRDRSYRPSSCGIRSRMRLVPKPE